MARRSKRANGRSGEDTRDSRDSRHQPQAAADRPLVPDAPGEGINHKRPARLIAAASFFGLWFAYLIWIAFASV